MNLTEFEEAFAKLRALGWIASQRRGPTGVGHTLEHALGLTENNIALPDLGEVELKGYRINSSSLITLFTFNNKVWRMDPLDAVRAHGTPNKAGRLGLFYTMSRTPNGSGLFLHVEEDSISVRHIAGAVLAQWSLETLCERFMQKLPSLVLVGAFSEMRGDREWFRFDRAQLLRETSAVIIRNQFLTGNIVLDLRLRERKNHGTAFRARKDKLPSLFKEVSEL